MFHKFSYFLRTHETVQELCVLCAECISLRNNKFINNETLKIDNGLGELDLKRVETIVEGIAFYDHGHMRKLYVKRNIGK